MDARDIAERLKDRYPDVQVARGEATLVVDRSELLGTLENVAEEDDLAFRSLSDLSATDWPGRVPRFWIAYHLYSIEHRHRLRLKVGVPDGDATVPTVTGLYPTANWQEREVFDMFGVTFEGHPDLRRILMPDDWEGHPLRKDYGLGGVGTQYKGAFIPPVDQRSQ